jgi:hypothetical protein
MSVLNKHIPSIVLLTTAGNHQQVNMASQPRRPQSTYSLPSEPRCFSSQPHENRLWGPEPKLRFSAPGAIYWTAPPPPHTHRPKNDSLKFVVHLAPVHVLRLGRVPTCPILVTALVGPTHPPIQWLPGTLSSEVSGRPRRTADHSPPF